MAFDPYHKWLGIPPDQQPPTHYRLLGIAEFESEADVIDGSAERQTVYLRTFQTGPDAELAERLLNEVAAARVCLLDDKAKLNYDGQLKEKQAAAEPPPAPRLPEISVAADRLTRPKTIVQWPTPWTQAHWFAAGGGALGTLLLVIVAWAFGPDDTSPKDMSNTQSQQQSVAVSKRLNTAEKVKWKDDLVVLVDIDCTNPEMVNEDLLIQGPWKQTEEGLVIRGTLVPGLVTRETFPVINLVVDLTVALGQRSNNCWGIGLGKSRVGLFSDARKSWFKYGRWNAGSLTKADNHPLYSRNHVEGIESFQDSQSHLRWILSTEGAFQEQTFWVNETLLFHTRERRTFSEAVPVVVHASHVSVIVKRLRISTFQ